MVSNGLVFLQRPRSLKARHTQTKQRTLIERRRLPFASSEQRQKASYKAAGTSPPCVGRQCAGEGPDGSRRFRGIQLLDTVPDSFVGLRRFWEGSGVPWLPDRVSGVAKVSEGFRRGAKSCMCPSFPA